MRHAKKQDIMIHTLEEKKCRQDFKSDQTLDFPGNNFEIAIINTFTELK